MIDKNTLIADILSDDDVTGMLLSHYGICGCKACSLSAKETLGEACTRHGADAGAVLSALNKLIAKKDVSRIKKTAPVSELLSADPRIKAIIVKAGIAEDQLDSVAEQSLEAACLKFRANAESVITRIKELFESKVTKGMTVASVIAENSHAEAVLTEKGIGGIACARAKGVTFAEACSTFGTDADMVKAKIDEYVALRVTRDMIICDALAKHEKVAEVFARRGIDCADCALAKEETVEQACRTHNVEADTLVREINEEILATMTGKKK